VSLLTLKKVDFPKVNPTYLAALVPTAVALNFAGTAIRQAVGIPLFLDTGGTILVSLIAGPWYGALVAILSAIVRAITLNPMMIFIFPVGVVCALIVGYAARYSITRSWLGLLLTLFVMVPFMSVVSAFVYAYIYGGFSGSAIDILSAVFIKSTGSIFKGLFISQMLTSWVDKGILLAIDVAILRALPVQYQILTPFGKTKDNKIAS